MRTALESEIYEERIQELHLLSLSKRQLCGDITAFKHVKGYCKEDGYKLFLCTKGKTSNNGFNCIKGNLV